MQQRLWPCATSTVLRVDSTRPLHEQRPKMPPVVRPMCFTRSKFLTAFGDGGEPAPLHVLSTIDNTRRDSGSCGAVPATS